MNRGEIRFGRRWRVLTATAGLLSAIASPAGELKRTNVLFIISDDLNDHVSTYGHGLVQTPNLDRLAARGVRFERAYCQFPLCGPSRVSFLSGRRPETTGIMDNRTPPRTRPGDIPLGIILDELDRSERWDDTIVVLTSDHGFHLGEHGGLWRKRTLFEEATRVPLIVAAPGSGAGRVSGGLVELVDLFPTLTDICGLPPADGMEGVSFAPLLEHPERDWKTAVFTSVVHNPPRIIGRSVRTERYRYTEWGSDSNAVELYDLHADPGEFRNLARVPQHADLLRMMARLLGDGWRAAKPAPESVSQQSSARADSSASRLPITP